MYADVTSKLTSRSLAVDCNLEIIIIRLAKNIVCFSIYFLYSYYTIQFPWNIKYVNNVYILTSI